jgi:hypothetical protein
VSIAPKQQAEIVEPGDDALKLHAIDQKDRERRLGLANVIEKSVLQGSVRGLPPLLLSRHYYVHCRSAGCPALERLVETAGVAMIPLRGCCRDCD